MKYWFLTLASIIILGIAAIAVWLVRQYLPLVGLVGIVAALVLIGYAVVYLIRFGELHLAAKERQGRLVHLTEHGAYLLAPKLTPLHPASVHIAHRVTVEADEEPQRQLPAPTFTVPTFAELLATRQITPHEAESILGFTDGKSRMGQWAMLHSFMALGISGSGKSSTVSYYVALAVLHGARLLVIDPDAEEDDSLTQRLAALSFAFLCPPGIDARSATRVLDVAEQELESPGGYPVVWCVDEFSMIMRAGEKGLGEWADVADRLAANVENWAQRGRKRKRTVIAIGQIGKASRTGGTELRASMTATFVHRLSAQQARLVLDGPDAKRCPTLDVGEVVVLLSNSPETYRMHIPYTTPDDMLQVARIMGVSDMPRNFADFRNTTKSLKLLDSDAEGNISDFTEEQDTDPLQQALQATGISETDLQRIISMAQKGMKRTQIRDAMGYTGPEYWIIKTVLDAHAQALQGREA